MVSRRELEREVNPLLTLGTEMCSTTPLNNRQPSQWEYSRQCRASKAINGIPNIQNWPVGGILGQRGLLSKAVHINSECSPPVCHSPHGSCLERSGQRGIRTAAHRRRKGGTPPPLRPPPPPPLPMFEADSQNFALAPSVPRGLKLESCGPPSVGTIGGPKEEGCPSQHPPPPSDPPSPPSAPSNTSLAQAHAALSTDATLTSYRTSTQTTSCSLSGLRVPSLTASGLATVSDIPPTRSNLSLTNTGLRLATPSLVVPTLSQRLTHTGSLLHATGTLSASSTNIPFTVTLSNVTQTLIPVTKTWRPSVSDTLQRLTETALTLSQTPGGTNSITAVATASPTPQELAVFDTGGMVPTAGMPFLLSFGTDQVVLGDGSLNGDNGETFTGDSQYSPSQKVCISEQVGCIGRRVCEGVCVGGWEGAPSTDCNVNRWLW